MDFNVVSDQQVEAELGRRFRALRLRRNLTQQALADRVALSLNAIKALEKGRAKLATVIAVLRELGALDQLDGLIPEVNISPLQLAKQRGHARQRASGSRGDEDEESAW